MSDAQKLKDPSAKCIAYAKDLITKIDIELELSSLQKNGHLRLHPTSDVAVIKIAEIKNSGQGNKLTLMNDVKISGLTPACGGLVGMTMKNCRRYADAEIPNEVFLFGYPRSLSQTQQIDHTRPLLRRGIIAGKNDANQTIIIDCPVYQGNSGGLVVEVEAPDEYTKNFYGVGVAIEFVPFFETFRSLQYGTINTSTENSGYSIVVPMDRVLELL